MSIWKYSRSYVLATYTTRFMSNSFFSTSMRGLNSIERSMINGASGGALGDMTHAKVRHLIEKMTSNSQKA